MINRSIYPALQTHLNKPQVTVITGMRRVGKSTAVKQLLQQIPHTNKVYLDLERVENRYILNQPNYRDVEIDLAIAGVDLTLPAVVALDEIQLVPQSTSVIKYLYDTYGTKFIVTGSSSFYLKNQFSESLAGRKRIFEMFPLDFAEFVAIKGESTDALRQFANQPFRLSYYLKWKQLYEEFLRFGGFPEVALAETNDDRQAYLRDIINAYIELDIKLLSDFSVSDVLYKLIRLLAARTGSKVDYTKISGLLGIDRGRVKEYISLLEHTYFIKLVDAFSQNSDRLIAKQPKVYLADTGLLQQLGQVSSGQVFENAIALQLSGMGSIQFYQKVNGNEIDFILDSRVAIEVKETPAQVDLRQLTVRAAKIGLTDLMLIGRHQPASSFTDFNWGGGVM